MENGGNKTKFVSAKIVDSKSLLKKGGFGILFFDLDYIHGAVDSCVDAVDFVAFDIFFMDVDMVFIKFEHIRVD